MAGSRAVGEGWGPAATYYFGAHREVHLVHETSAEEGVIEFAASFAKQAPDSPLFSQPA
jgi:hypothetical protein